MSVGKIILICAAGLTLNLTGSLVANFFGWPIYFDTAGTIIIAALGGYAPGIAVGFFTNLIKSFFQPSEMYFCSVNLFVAIFTAFFAQKGFFDNFIKVLLLIFPLTFFAGTLDLLIDKFLTITSIPQAVNEVETNFLANFIYEFLDKTFSICLAFFILKMTPQQTKNFLHVAWQRQAPLSDEMKDVISRQSYLASSLRTKMLLILTLSSLVLSFSIALISYLLFKNTALEERIKTVDGMIAVAISEINPYRIDNFLKFGREADGYKETEEKLYAIKNSSTDVKYLYVYRILEDGCHVVFDLNTAMSMGDNPGEVVPLDKDFSLYRNDLLAGKPIPPIITDNEYGYLLTLYKPIYDGSGKCQCYVAVDFSMDMLVDYTHIFIIKLIALFAGCFVFILAIGLAFIENNIILPVNTMAYCARNFAYENVNARLKNVERIRGLKIKTGDEIENLYTSLLKTTENFLRYLEHLQRAKVQVADMRVKVFAMDEIAHKDSLTGVKNKTAYNETIAKLNETISAGTAKFCIVMVDVNYLKRINDTYGHERGNTYLLNACRLICTIFGEDFVYRIGGDEFVVILEKEHATLCKYFVAHFKSEMNRRNASDKLRPWEKTSAAIGVATYKADIYQSAEQVFKHADEQMYENKLAMKAVRTD